MLQFLRRDQRRLRLPRVAVDSQPCDLPMTNFLCLLQHKGAPILQTKQPLFWKKRQICASLEGASDGALFEGTLMALLKALWRHFLFHGKQKKVVPQSPDCNSTIGRSRRRPSWPLQRNCSQKDAGETYFWCFCSLKRSFCSRQKANFFDEMLLFYVRGRSRSSGFSIKNTFFAAVM